MILAVLAVVTATFQPPAPTVGDPITIRFEQPVRLDPSPSYEIVQQSGTTVVIRTFRPVPFALSGTAGDVRFRNLIVPVRSVLKRNDDLKPAPLTPPVAAPYPRVPFIAIGIAALCALAAWAAVWWLATRPQREVVPALTPDERFRHAVLALRNNPSHPRRWAALADATRVFLATTRSHLGSELTTSEVVPRLRDHEGVVREILGQGDMEKFSPWGAQPRDFDDIATRSLHLVIPSESERPGREAAR